MDLPIGTDWDCVHFGVSATYSPICYKLKYTAEL